MQTWAPRKPRAKFPLSERTEKRFFKLESPASNLQKEIIAWPTVLPRRRWLGAKSARFRAHQFVKSSKLGIENRCFEDFVI
jgi:hypothetical protein